MLVIMTRKRTAWTLPSGNFPSVVVTRHNQFKSRMQSVLERDKGSSTGRRMSFLQGVVFAKGPGGCRSGVYHRKGTAQGTCVSQGVGYRCREVAARTRVPHSLCPGIPGGVSASATGSHRRLLRQSERCSPWRRVPPAVLPRTISGRGCRGRTTS